METQLKLRDVEIGSYINYSTITKKQLEEYQTQFDIMKDNLLDCEQKAYNLIKQKIVSAYYPIIDLSFLQKSNIVNTGIIINKLIKKGIFNDTYKKIQYKVKLPAFSVYKYFGKSDFKIQLFADGDCELLSDNNNLPHNIVYHLLVSLGADPNSPRMKFYDSNNYYYETNLNDDESLDIDENIKFTSILQTIVPLKTKQRIEKAREYFENDDIYIVAETKPKEWNVKLIQSDPIVIGIIGNQAFLIDHFNNTFIEKLVTNNFSNQNQN